MMDEYLFLTDGLHKITHRDFLHYPEPETVWVFTHIHDLFNFLGDFR